ncbi:flavin-containing monooxygenase [Burkholderia ubonensis]|uniref:flavin-containing monooxygenase n=1 Tax=Burkholderia ubonensis TaxID=101571 RepID=UPI00075C761E|nr:NAD(P)/FAD-dependent oxidoreductase [Burkholderia ubonensis]KVD67988.1 4-hydroxyacetophenone monooxygenase [Burkholderia ubonensis]
MDIFNTADNNVLDVIIIGTGFCGLGIASQLKRRGVTSMIILERAGDVGGAWRDNQYPGAACDQPSHLYSFSFRLNPDWPSVFSSQPAIWQYLRNTANEEGLLPFIHFNSDMEDARWDGDQQCWVVRGGSKVFRGKLLISAAGLLSDPKLPDIPGLESFSGEMFHSARWNHKSTLENKRVGVVGTGASAIQIIPEVAKVASRLTVFQRTAPWIVPRPDRDYTEAEKGMFRKLPSKMQELRTSIFWENEERFAQRAAVPSLLKKATDIALAHLEQQVPDPVLRKKLTPNYEIGCKRILKSSDYYPALARSNVELVTDGISKIDDRSVVTKSGERYELDALVLSTGFEATELPISRRIFGRNGQSLSSRWSDGAEAFATTSVSGFPNFFVLGGPNTGIGHNSQVYMFEAQMQHILRAIDSMRKKGADVLEVSQAAEDRFRDGIEKRASTTVWMTGGCATWYVDPRSGRLTTLWPDYSHVFQEEISAFNEADYIYGTPKTSVPKAVSEAALR